jgi:hypothetical protein
MSAQAIFIYHEEHEVAQGYQRIFVVFRVFVAS